MLQDLAIHLRTMQLYAHHCHGVCKGATFFEDHSFFGDSYKELDGDYDSIAERIVHLGGDDLINPLQILEGVKIGLMDAPMEAKDSKIFFAYMYKQEKRLAQIIEQVCQAPSASQGLKNLVADIADRSEVRCYRQGQRIK